MIVSCQDGRDCAVQTYKSCYKLGTMLVCPAEPSTAKYSTVDAVDAARECDLESELLLTQVKH